MVLDNNKLSLESKKLFMPSLNEIANVLKEGLGKNFLSALAEVVDCPDLSQEPFNLASAGLGGSPRLIEVGGPQYLVPLLKKEKVYDIKNHVKSVGLEEALVLGAAAGPWSYTGKNCELIANLKINKAGVENKSYTSKLDENEENCIVELLPDSETRHALLANFYFCQGLPSKVVKVVCKNRIGDEDFVSIMRKALHDKYKGEPIGMGGAFFTKSGKVKLHTMPSFPTEPIKSESGLNEWFKYFNMSAPIVSVGTLISRDIPGMDLRLQHFHSFSNHKEAGHFHTDTTPSDVEYVGYFNLAEYIFRIDRPIESHQ